MKPPAEPPIVSPATAVKFQAEANRKRALAATMREEWGDPTGAKFEERDADFMQWQADRGFDPLNHTTDPLKVGNGGEMIAGTKENLTERTWLVDTVRQRPDMLAADASVKRAELAERANVLTTGVDAAATIQAQNSLEKMLAHQMAAAHSLAMKLAGQADDFLAHCKSWDAKGRQQLQSIEAARMAQSAARLMEAFNKGLLTLDRLRNGGRQTMVVQHVQVGDGGQAVVAGVAAPREKAK